MALGFLMVWLRANILLHLDKRTLALFAMSDLQIREINLAYEEA